MFEKELPGYDAWLDNHGNPGGAMDDDEHWALSDPKVIVTKLGLDETGLMFLIRRYDADERLLLTVREDGRYLFDGQDIETESFMQWVGLLDEFNEQDERTAIIGHDDEPYTEPDAGFGGQDITYEH